MFNMFSNKRVLRAMAAVFLAVSYSIGITVAGAMMVSNYADQGLMFSLVSILSCWIFTGAILLNKYGSLDINVEDPRLSRRLAEDSAFLTTLFLTILFGWAGLSVGIFMEF